MIYIIGGPGKTGSSAIAVRLSKEFNIPRLYAGGYLRTEALKAHCVKDDYVIPDNISEWDLDYADIKTFRKLCTETDRDIDREMDLFLLNGMVESVVSGKDIIIESKVMARLMHAPIFQEYLDVINKEKFQDPNEYLNPQRLKENTQAIWIHSDIRTRALRVLNKRRGPNPKGIISFTENEINTEIEDLICRQQVDKDDYIRKYGMSDYPDPYKRPDNLFGTVIDNSHQTEQQTFADIINIFHLSNSPL